MAAKRGADANAGHKRSLANDESLGPEEVCNETDRADSPPKRTRFTTDDNPATQSSAAGSPFTFPIPPPPPPPAEDEAADATEVEAAVTLHDRNNDDEGRQQSTEAEAHERALRCWEDEDFNITATFFWDQSVTIPVPIAMDKLKAALTNTPPDPAAQLLVMIEAALDDAGYVLEKDTQVYDVRGIWPYHGGWSNAMGMQGRRRETILFDSPACVTVAEMLIKSHPTTYLEFKLRDAAGHDMREIKQQRFNPPDNANDKLERRWVPSPSYSMPPDEHFDEENGNESDDGLGDLFEDDAGKDDTHEAAGRGLSA